MNRQIQAIRSAGASIFILSAVNEISASGET
jgi:hypothetical protein